MVLSVVVHNKKFNHKQNHFNELVVTKLKNYVQFLIHVNNILYCGFTSNSPAAPY